MRRFKLSDLPIVLGIEHSSFCIEAYDKEDLLRFFKKNSKSFIVVEVNGNVVGYVGGHISGKKGHFDSIAVQKNFRGKRIGQKLFDFLINYFKKREVKEVELEVRAENKKVINWYRREGFKVVKCLKDYYPDGGSAYRMGKSLN